MHDITNKQDIKTFVDQFYSKVRVDPVIGPTFAAVVENDHWSPHLERMYSFWNTVLFRAPDYIGNPFTKHSGLPIEKVHFDRWVELMNETLDECFVGERADEVKERVGKMSILFQKKLTLLKGDSDFKNIF